MNLVIRSNSGNAQIWKSGTGYSGYGGTSSLNIYNSNSNISFFSNGRTSYDMQISGGNVDVAGSITASGGDGGARMGVWPTNSDFAMFGTANMTGSEYALISDGTNTYISAGTGGSSTIRGGSNDSDPQIEVTNDIIRIRKITSSEPDNVYFQFLDNATEVGVIGTGYSDELYIASSGKSGIRFTTSAVAFGNDTGTIVNNTYDLGQNSYRVRSGYFGTDVRAPVFYDIDDTAYYTNPASTSNVSRLQIGNYNGSSHIPLNIKANTNNTSILMGRSNNYVTTFSVLPWGSGRTYLSSGTHYENGSWTVVSDGGSASLFAFAGADGAKWWAGTGGSSYSNVVAETTLWENTGRWRNNVTASNDVKAPIFYDSNDTAYYVDPASSTSAKLRQYVNIGDSSSYSSNSGNWGARLNVVDDVHARIDVGQDANSMLSTWYAHTGHSGPLFGTSTAHPLRMMYNGNEVGYWNADFLYHSSDIRSPIFYDSANTGYYVDPASTSRMDSVQFYDRIGIGSNGTRGFVNSGSAGIWYSTTTDAADWFGGLDGSNWRLYYSSANKMLIDTSANLFAYGSMRSPIFYDNNNTGYYVDPNSISNLFSIETRRFRVETASNASGAFSSNASLTDKDGRIIFPVSPTTTTQTSNNGGGWANIGWQTTSRSGEQMHRNTSARYAYGGSGTAMGFYIEAGTGEAGGICLDEDSVNVYGSSDSGTTFRVIDKDSDVVTFEMLQSSWNGVFRGDVIAYGSLSSISDRRIKENIQPYENVLDKVMTLGVYSYNKITAPKDKRDKLEIGVIAQEVEEVFPELVNEEKVDKPEDANGLEKIKTVDYEHMTAILLQAVKELKAEIEDLKNGSAK